jgi:ankyrin repeat protein
MPHVFCRKYTDCVDLLLSYNANKDGVNDHSQTVVHLAVKNRDVTTLRVLRKHKCDINKQVGSLPFQRKITLCKTCS